MRFLVILASFVVSVLGHAKLNSPSAFNPQPNTGNPCGGGAFSATPRAQWVEGTTVQAAWQVVAGDGTGAVTVSFDENPNGANPANGDLGNPVVATPTPNSVSTFTLSFTVPDLTCLGPKKTCTVQFKSSSNWYACTTVSIGTQAEIDALNAPAAGGSSSSTGSAQSGGSDFTPTSPVSNLRGGTCVTATLAAVPQCESVAGKSVLIGLGETLASLNNVIQETMAATLPNRKVFEYGSNGEGCAAAYRAYLCGVTFPLCPSEGVDAPEYPYVDACRQSCEQMRCLCGLNYTHDGLYVCANNLIVTGSDSNGECLHQYGPVGTQCPVNIYNPDGTLAAAPMSAPLSLVVPAVVAVAVLFNRLL